MGSIGLTAGQAHAFVVTVGGSLFEVTTFTGSYNDNVAKFNTAANGGLMPWWGSSSLAGSFVEAVKGELGYPNPDPIGSGNAGPFFGFDLVTFSLPPVPVAVRARTFTETDVQRLAEPSLGTARVWAQATLVPAPQSILGILPLAAAAGARRQLRKRYQS